MAKMTLLEMTQNILNDMDSDSVNDIDDTVESQQVATIIKTAYFKLLSVRDDWPFLHSRTTFTGLADVDNPTSMEIPEGLNKVYWVKYNKKDVAYLPPKDFQDMLDQREELADVVDEDGYGLNRDPQYWTSFDEETVWFDSIDLAEEATLQESKCVVFGNIVPTWTASANFIPLLPEKMFPTLLADAKGTCFLDLKQQANAKEEDFAKKGTHKAQVYAYKVNNAEPTNNDLNYGRK